MRALGAACLACLALAGTAQAAPGGPGATVRRYVAALGRTDAPAACRELTPASRDKLKQFAGDVLHMAHPSCRAAIDALLHSSGGAALRDLSRNRILRVAVHGARAEVRIAHVNRPIDVVRASGRWLIDSEPTGETD
jgi:hypothetical protein